MDQRHIALIDDHPLLAAALRSELQRSGATVELLDPTVGRDALLDALAERSTGTSTETTSTAGAIDGKAANDGPDDGSGPVPDCVVVDLGLPLPGGGATLIGPIAERGLRVLVLTGETDRQLLAKSSAAGAEAIVSKAEPLSEIVDTILQVAGGQTVRAAQRAQLATELRMLSAEREKQEAPFAELTPREQQVLAGLMDGQAPSVLAQQNFVSVATIRTQIKNLLSKLGVSSQLQAVAMAHRSHWGPDQDPL